MTSSRHSLPAIDLSVGIRTTREDVLALRKARPTAPMSVDEYLVFLAQFDHTPSDVLRKRSGPRGDVPFTL